MSQPCDLTNNNISSIENGTFFNCDRLVHLYLNHVPLVSLHKESLKGLPRILDIVVIRAPDLCYIEPVLFDFTVAEYITITSDCLRNLSGRIFGPNSSFVGSIHIEFMPKLQEISRKIFDGISYLGKLRLRYTELTRLPKGLFDNTMIGSHMDLSRNRLEYLEDNFLESSPTLNGLFLYRNNLTHVSVDVFAGLKSLKTLLLFQNRLTEIPTLKHLPKLETL
ncbi:uncharacterized protein [Amphiura filiformis]|uniref:uncharacterized protein n=1 Tax=Amphiura filiformis TaxID=82378 RepID=UPI003B220F49